MNISATDLTLYAALWIGIVYVLNCLIARGLKPIDVRMALLYSATVAMLGVFGEVFVGSLYEFLFDRPLWQYRILPIHEGYTSMYAPVIWGILGFYLYLMHDTLVRLKKYTQNRLAITFMAEAIVIELLANLSFLLLFDQYLFYYLPSDLWHLTSVQTLPFYLAAGFVVTHALKRFSKDPPFFTLMCLALGGTLVFLS